MIIVVCGATASYKTRLSVDLAKKYNGIVVNADSLQVYKGLDIATAKIKEEEKEGIPHYLFDIVDKNDMYTVYDYQKDARKIIEENKDNDFIDEILEKVIDAPIKKKSLFKKEKRDER